MSYLQPILCTEMFDWLLSAAILIDEFHQEIKSLVWISVIALYYQYCPVCVNVCVFKCHPL